MLTTTKLIKRAIAVLAIMSVIGVTSSSAFATDSTTIGCTVYDFGTDTNATRITLHCLNDVNHYTTNYAGCPSVSVEQVKLWSSQITAALLSGKKLNIWWNNACGTRAMYSLYIESQ